MAIQNERYDDWTNILSNLKKIFPKYKGKLEQNIPGGKIPESYNSCAAEGNFLEVLNMSLNGKRYIIIHALKWVDGGPSLRLMLAEL